MIREGKWEKKDKKSPLGLSSTNPGFHSVSPFVGTDWVRCTYHNSLLFFSFFQKRNSVTQNSQHNQLHVDWEPFEFRDFYKILWKFLCGFLHLFTFHVYLLHLIHLFSISSFFTDLFTYQYISNLYPSLKVNLTCSPYPLSSTRTLRHTFPRLPFYFSVLVSASTKQTTSFLDSWLYELSSFFSVNPPPTFLVCFHKSVTMIE